MISPPQNVFDILSRDQVKALSQPSDLLAAVHLLIRIAVDFGLFWWSLKLAVAGSVYFIPVFLLCGIWHSFWGYAGIAHEFYHARVFSSRLINQLCFSIASYLTLNNPSFFAESHALHHRHTFTSDDNEGRSIQAWGLPNVFWYSTIDLPLLVKRMVYLITNAAGFVRRGGQLDRLSRKHQREALRMLSVHLVIHVFLIASTETLVANLLFLFLPMTGLLPARLLAQVQHLGLQEYLDQGPLCHSRSLTCHWLIEFLYAGMNFHAEHHLFPSIPYYKLSQVHLLLVEKGLLREVRLLPFLIYEFPHLMRRK